MNAKPAAEPMRETSMMDGTTSPSPTLVSETASPEPVGLPVTILTVGDMMLGRSVNTIGYRKRNYFWSLEEVNDQLAPFSLVIANLETPIIYDCPRRDDGMIFCADASSSEAIAASNIDLVTLANNHIYNYGIDGYRQTRALLAQAGQDFVGRDELYRVTLAGTDYGVIAHDDVSFPVDLEIWKEYVASQSAQVDTLLVALHFGEEYRYQPTARQVALARASIDAGATLVIGNHSHWLGTVEKYGSGAIIYSHGNFVFDQEWSRETKSGLAAAWTFAGGQLTSVSIYPIFITHYGLAHWAAGTSEGEQILDRFLAETGLGERVGDHVEILFQAEEEEKFD